MTFGGTGIHEKGISTMAVAHALVTAPTPREYKMALCHTSLRFQRYTNTSTKLLYIKINVFDRGFTK